MSAVTDVYRSIRSGAAPAAKSLLFRTGAMGVLRAVRPSDGLAILRYHAICRPDAGYASPDICVSPQAFERHAAYLARRYRVLALPEAVRQLRHKRSPGRNAVAITFDDGYRDNLAAAKVLSRYGLTATFYITAGCVDGRQPFWPAELRYLVGAIEEPSVELNANGRRIALPLRTAADRQDAVARLTRLFKSVRISVRERLRESLRELAPGAATPQVMLSWADVCELAAMGMTIGAHTLTHANLPSAGPDAREEIAASRRLLEQTLGVPVTMFSYPNGGAERYYTLEIQRFVREAGFEAATTSRNGVASAESDPFALERIRVSERLEDLAFALEVERFAFRPVGGRG